MSTLSEEGGRCRVDQGALGLGGLIESTADTERYAAYLVLANVLLATIVAIWRPRLAREAPERRPD